ncbi:50S ribosomal protein L13 [Endomicrobiia bacterium]|nr:50S ribosomal protein L13 [Endomicrobiia bacterium]GHT20644.1 50S ribosomal protein L13 [Endomicrobiia bacterium]GHT26230.1 50S ribosomal protein L13 [Endomicrobiia bacterium]GHT31639.1 50S ribosomal protein L13 [Endomicrobiia bacterium]
MNKKTFLPKQDAIERKWHLIDADGKILGRLAVKISELLRGKNKVFYTNHIDCGDFVVVTNASKIVLTGKKLDQKTYFTYSGYPGGAKLTPYSVLMAKSPEKALFVAVKGMLPKNKLADRQITRLKVFKDDKHMHTAQVVASVK